MASFQLSKAAVRLFVRHELSFLKLLVEPFSSIFWGQHWPGHGIEENARPLWHNRTRLVLNRLQPHEVSLVLFICFKKAGFCPFSITMSISGVTRNRLAENIKKGSDCLLDWLIGCLIDGTPNYRSSKSLPQRMALDYPNSKLYTYIFPPMEWTEIWNRLQEVVAGVFEKSWSCTGGGAMRKTGGLWVLVPWRT